VAENGALQSSDALMFSERVTEHRVDVGSTVLHVVEDGPPAGTPLVLLNGAMCALPMWAKLMPQLAREFRVVRHDYRGTGQSEPGPDLSGYTLEQYADDLAAVLDALDITEAVVWAHAFGSRVAMGFAHRHPGRVSRLALFDAAVAPGDFAAMRRMNEVARERRRAAGIAEPEQPPGWNHHRSPETAEYAFGAGPRAGALASWLPSLRAPLLVATGEFDPNLVSSRDIVRAVPGSILSVIPLAGHGAIRQRPSVCLDLFLSFAHGLEPGVSPTP